MAALEPVIATLIANTTEFTASMDAAKAKMAELGASGDLAGAEGGLGALGAAGTRAGEDVKAGAENAAGGLTGLRGASRDASTAVEDVGSKAEKSGGLFSKFAGVLSNTGLPLGSLSEGLNKAGEASGELDTKGSSLFGHMAGIGQVAAIGLGAAFVGAAAEGIHLAMSMQSADSAIAVAAGTSIQSATAIGNAFLSTAGSSEFSGQEMATAFAGVAGQLKSTEGHALTTAQAMQIMGTAGDLATAKQISLGTATSAVAATMQAFQINTKGASGVSDVLLNASNATGQSVSGLGNALDKVKTKLGGMAPPLGQLAGLLVDMTNHGETGRAAMASLTTTFTNFLKPAAAVATAQNDLKAALSQLPPSLQTLGAQVASGTMTSTQYTAATKGLTSSQTDLIGKVKSAQTAVATAGDANAKMGITAVTATGQMEPMSSIIGQLHDKVQGMNTAQAIATLTSMGFGNASAKLVATIQAGPSAYDAATSSATKLGAAHAAAATQSHTLGVEFKTIKATAEDLLTQFGQFLIPIIQTLGEVVTDTTRFLLAHKDVLYALGILVGGFLTAVMTAFAVNTMASMIGSITTAGGRVVDLTGKLLGFGTQATATAATVDTESASMDASLAGVGTAATEAGTTIDTSLSTGITEAAATVETETTAMDASLAGVGEAGATSGAGLGAAGVGATGLAGGLTAVALPLAAVALGMYGLVSILPNGNAQINAWQTSLNKAANIPTTGIDALNAKIGITQQVLNQASGAAAAYQNQIGATGRAGTPAGSRGRPVPSGPDVSTISAEAQAALAKYNALLSEAQTNTAELSNITGLSTTSVNALAGTLNVNLTKGLNPQTIEAFTNYVKANGGAAAVTGAQWQASAALIQAALEQTEAKAAKAMPGVSKAVQDMVSSTQPALVTLVGKLNKTGDSAGGEFISAFLSNLTPAQLASNQMHNAITSPLLPLEQELRTINDTAAANSIAAFISHVPAAAAAAYNMKGNILGPLNGISADMQTIGDTSGINLVEYFLNHHPDALAAANEMKGSIGKTLLPLENDLLSVGDTSGANMVAGIIKHDNDAATAAKFFHDAIKHPLDPLIMELGTTGNLAGAAAVEDFAKNNPGANTAGKGFHDALSGPLATLAAELGVDGQTATSNTIQSFINAQGPAAQASAALGAALSGGILGALAAVNQAAGGTANIVTQDVALMGSLNAATPPKHSAAGNLLSAGEISVVGENGPELFIAGYSGAIVPINMTGGNGVAPIAATGGGGGDVSAQIVNQPINLVVNGQTLAQIVTQFQLRGARATGNTLGQYAGGTQTGTATSINTNAVPR